MPNDSGFGRRLVECLERLEFVLAAAELLHDERDERDDQQEEDDASERPTAVVVVPSLDLDTSRLAVRLASLFSLAGDDAEVGDVIEVVAVLVVTLKQVLDRGRGGTEQEHDDESLQSAPTGRVVVSRFVGRFDVDRVVGPLLIVEGIRLARGEQFSERTRAELHRRVVEMEFEQRELLVRHISSFADPN